LLDRLTKSICIGTDELEPFGGRHANSSDGRSIITPAPPNCRNVGTPNENMPVQRLGARTINVGSAMTGLDGCGRRA
jgi:hypothetical protein